MKMKINKTEFEFLIKHIINEAIESPFQIQTTEGKLEFLLTSLKDLIKDLSREATGDSIYYMNRLIKIVEMVDVPMVEGKDYNKRVKKFDKVMHEFGNGSLKTSAGDKVTNQKQAVAIAYSESGLDEESLVEFKPPSKSFNAWADLETGGSHSQGVRNRMRHTRRENAKKEKVTALNTANDYIRLIYEWGLDGDDEAQRIFNSLVKKYNKGLKEPGAPGTLTLSDLNKIAIFEPIKDRAIIPMLNDFINKEEERTNYFGWKHGNKPEQKLQIK
jgi:hypothetical protein